MRPMNRAKNRMVAAVFPAPEDGAYLSNARAAVHGTRDARAACVRSSPGAMRLVSAHIISATGGVAERLKAHAWKVCMRETVSRVRIPPPPRLGCGM